MPVVSSCCASAIVSQLYGRWPKPVLTSSAYEVTRRVVPNELFGVAPHSPFSAGLVRSQSGTKLWFASFQVRVTLLTTVSAGCWGSPS